MDFTDRDGQDYAQYSPNSHKEASKNETASHFIQSLKELAQDAQIDKLTEASLILHLTAAGLPTSDLNKSSKNLIIEELRQNPNLKDLTKILTKLKGIEADHVASTEKPQDVRSVKHEYDCKLCDNRHSRGECTYKCKHCKKFGHKSELCWQKFGRPEEHGKREREERERLGCVVMFCVKLAVRVNDHCWPTPNNGLGNARVFIQRTPRLVSAIHCQPLILTTNTIEPVSYTHLRAHET